LGGKKVEGEKMRNEKVRKWEGGKVRMGDNGKEMRKLE